jgi:hypothetical protein
MQTSSHKRMVTGLCGKLLLLALSLVPFQANAWWDANYSNRQQLTITTGSTAPDKGYQDYTVRLAALDTQTLIAGGQMQADCDDLRVVYYDGSSWSEVDRHVVNCNSAATEIRFMLQADIADDTIDSSYFIYYGYAGAGAPTAVSTTNVYLWYDDASTNRSGSYVHGRIDAWHGTGWDDSLAWNPAGYYTYSNGDNYSSGYRRDVDERDVLIEAEFYHTGCYPVNMTSGVMVRGIIDSGSGGSESSEHYYATNRGHQAACGGGYTHDGDIFKEFRTTTAVDGADPPAIASNQWRKQALAAFGGATTNLRFWDSDSGWSALGWPDAASLHASGTDGSYTGRGFAAIMTAQDQARVRNIIIRRYVEDEPVVAVGAVGPYSEYRFDECQYTGAAGEVIDTFGRVNGTAHNGVDTNVPGFINRHLDSDDRRDYVSTSIPLGSEWTISTWFQTPFTPGHNPFHTLGSAVRYIGPFGVWSDVLYLERGSGPPANRYRWRVFAPFGGGFGFGTFAFGSLSDDWHHLTLVGAGGWTYLYIDGVYIERVNAQAVGDLTYIGTSQTLLGSNWARGFRAPLDEYAIYNLALSPTEIAAVYNNQLAGNNYDGSARPAVNCGGVLLDHYEITHDGFGINCVTETITVAAIDDSTPSQPFDADGLTITIDTQSGRGDWSLVTGTGSFSNGTADDGVATYTFAAGETEVQLGLDYLEGTSPITLAVSDGSISDDGNHGPLPFSPNGFTVTSSAIGNPPVIPTPSFSSQIAGTDFPVYITAYGVTPADPVCGVIEAYSGQKALQFWSSYDNPASGTIQVSITDDNDTQSIGTSEVAATARAVTFTSGQAQVTAKYKDVGLISISMKDTSVADPNLPNGIRGTAQFVVKPDHFDTYSIQCDDGTNNPSPPAADYTGDPFCRAGEDFTVGIAARDAEGDTTPNFGNESESARLAAPAWSGSTAYSLGDIVVPTSPNGHSYRVVTAGTSGGSEPTWPTGGSTVGDGGVVWQDYTGYLPELIAPDDAVNPPLVSGGAPAFSNGTATATYNWPEVGIIRLTPHIWDGDYLGAGDVAATTTVNIGRFYPNHFTTAIGNGDFANGCTTGATPFTYIGQSFGYATAPTVVISAENSSNTITENYTGDFARLTLSGIGLTYPISDNTTLDEGGGNISVTSSVGTHTLSDNGDGTLTLTLGGASADAFQYARAQGRISPFNSDLTITLDSVSDGEASANDVPAPINPVANQQRFGSAFTEDVYGTMSQIGESLVMPVGVQYYDASGNWVTNSDDNCSSYTYVATDTGITTNSAPVSPVSLVNGVGDLTLTITADDATPGGSTLVDTVWDSWLRYDFDGVDNAPVDGNLYDDNPSATATFGIFRSDDRFIYWEEAR